MSGIFLMVLEMSLTASYVVLTVIVVRLLLKRAPKVFSYLLWLVVLFRLVCPFSFESSWSLLPVDKVEVSAYNYESERVENTVGYDPQFSAPLFESSKGAVSGIPENVDTRRGVIKLGSTIWLLGIAGFLLYAFASYIRLKRKLTTAILVSDNIYETDRIQTPFVLGLITPRIYLPSGLAGAEADYIIKHEKTHIRRRDHLIKPLAFLVLALHWFNPLIWLSYFLMIRDMEMSCDESVMRQSGEDIRVSYSNSLLALAVKQSGLISPLAFGEGDVKTRIKNILNYKKPAFWVVAVAILIVIAVTVGLLANPQQEAQPNVLDNKYADDEVGVKVELLLGKIITDGPVASSNPFDYIISSEAFIELADLGEPAMEYMFESFMEGNEDGLREYIMALACAKVMGVLDEEKGIGINSGREWFYKYGAVVRSSSFDMVDADYEMFENVSGKPKRFLPQDTDMRNMDEVISACILAINRRSYRVGEKAIEAHKIYRMEEDNGLTNVYLLVGFRWFGFENGVFTTVSGNGGGPVRIQLKQQENGEYEMIEYKEAMDGGMWEKSIREMFPEDLAEIVFKGDKKGSEELWNMQVTEAEEYLEEINRKDAQVAARVDKDRGSDESGKAIYLVTAMQPDFPEWNGSKEVLVRTGGKYPGLKVRCLLETKCVSAGEGRYLVTLTKTWDIKVNGTRPVSYWQYEVTGERVELVKEQDEDWMIRIIK